MRLDREARCLRLGYPLTLLVLFGVSSCLTMATFWLETGPITDCIRNLLHQPLLIPLNWFPSLALMTVFWFLTKNVFVAGAVTAVIVPGMAYINLLKFEGREDTLVPADITLVREAVQALGEYRLNLHPAKLAVLCAVVVVLAVTGIFVHSSRPTLPVRLAAALACIAVSVLSVGLVYMDKDLYAGFEVPNMYNIGSVYNTLGFNYCFLYNFNQFSVDRPEGYSSEEAEGWTQEFGVRGAGIRPNVVIVMCEAYSDLSEAERFNWSPDNDPMADFYAAADSPNALTGYLCVTNYGAGTANTEFDVMTGMQTSMIGERTTSAFRAVRKQTNSIAWTLAADGYQTFFLHPGESWFYNRNSVYARLGVPDQIFMDAFDSGDYKGPMISDAAFLEHLEAELERRMNASDAPVFCYSVTIQNHQAYNWEKYDPDPPLAQTVSPLSADAAEAVSVYMEGIRDSSAMLLELTEFLDSLPEPTVLAFYGDHRPNVGGAPEELGLSFNTDGSKSLSPSELVDTYRVPFLLRVNAAYADVVGDPQSAFSALELPPGSIISDNYFGALLLEFTGHSGENAFFDYLNVMRRILPVVRKKDQVYMLWDGSLVSVLTPEDAALVDKLSKWEYYMLS